MAAAPSSFYARTRDARKILVVDLGFLGDTVHLVPALWDLKRGYPAAALHVLTSPVGTEVLRLAPCVDRVWALEMAREKRRLSEQWQIVRGLRRERFDAVYNFSGADRTLFMTALSGARSRVAYPGGRQHFWNRWLVPDWVAAQDPNRTVYEVRRQVLADCGLSLGPARFELQPDESARQWAAATVPAGCIHISVNSAKPTREWPLESHVELFGRLWAKHPDFRLVASCSAKPRERERLIKLAGGVNDPRLLLLPAEMTIAQLAAVLQRCRLHIGPDSGVLHLAVALNVPTVSFFREQGAWRSFLPNGPKHRVISMPCTCVDGRAAPCEALGRAECFARIEPARVAALVEEQLG